MALRKVRDERAFLRGRFILGGLLGACYACVEYLVRKDGEGTVIFFPLLIKAIIVGSLIAWSVSVFNLYFEDKFNQKPFLYLVVVKTLFFTVCTSFWLIVVNGVWYAINGGIPFADEMMNYLTADVYLINLLTIFLIVMVIVTLNQINSLHRKGELVNFITGRYHRPVEVKHIFCFVDLKGSTAIAERLGHFRYANFLRDYYSDITEALRRTKAQIYQYVGDEVVLSWTYRRGFENNNFVHCYFLMKQTFERLREKYMEEYGVCPDFRAGAHGGSVIVTWVGGLKREIVYVGDVINTTARIEGECKRLKKDFLISGDVLKELREEPDFKAKFIEEITPRGKQRKIQLYSVDPV